jgi:hypothetical protein
VFKYDMYGNVVDAHKHYKDPWQVALEITKENEKSFAFAPGQNIHDTGFLFWNVYMESRNRAHNS